MRPTYKQRIISACLIISTLLLLIILANCNTIETLSTLTPLENGLQEEAAEYTVYPTSPTLSLLTEWEIQTVNGVTWHPMNHIIAIAGSDLPDIRGIRLYDAQTGQELWFKEDIPGGLAFTPDGSLIATTPFYEAHVQMLEAEDGHSVSTISANNCSAGHWLLFNTTGDSLLTGLGSGHIDWETALNLWDLQTGECHQLQKRPGFLNFIDVTEDFRFVIMSILSEVRKVHVWDSQKEIDVCSLVGDLGLFVPQTSQFAILNVEKLSFYNLSSCQLKKEFVIDSPFRGYIDFSPNGTLFATAGKSLQLWETSSGRLLFEEKLPKKLFGASSRPSFIFSPDGEFLLAVFSTQDDSNVSNTVIQVWRVINHD